MIKIKSVVIVEGKYDKINLQNYIDATIIKTDGFGIFKDKEKQKLIKQLAKKNGAVVITDSDSAGAQIRAFIKNICKIENIINVYLPQIEGKEKRKTAPSKAGFLGAEGLDGETILKALKKSGVTSDMAGEREKITKADMYAFSLSGKQNSKFARDDFANFTGLPIGMSSNAFLDALNSIFTREEFIEEAQKWHHRQVKN